MVSNRAFPIQSALRMTLTLNSQFTEVSDAVITNIQFTQFWIVYASLLVFTLTSDNDLTEELHCLLFEGDAHQLRALHTREQQLFLTLLSKLFPSNHKLSQPRKRL